MEYQLLEPQECFNMEIKKPFTYKSYLRQMRVPSGKVVRFHDDPQIPYMSYLIGRVSDVMEIIIAEIDGKKPTKRDIMDMYISDVIFIKRKFVKYIEKSQTND